MFEEDEPGCYEDLETVIDVQLKELVSLQRRLVRRAE